MTEPTNSDVLDAVTLELSRFTREVVAEMHRLRDELAVERQRTDQLESTVTSLAASLRKFDTQAANIVDHFTKLSSGVDRRLEIVEQRVNEGPALVTTAVAPETVVASVVDEPAVQAASAARDDDIIQFAPLTLTLDPVEPGSPHDTSIDDLVARVVGAIDASTSRPTVEISKSDSVQSGSAR
jgi:hypothetical protein